jgi:hypothetical protein
MEIIKRLEAIEKRLISIERVLRVSGRDPPSPYNPPFPPMPPNPDIPPPVYCNN